MSENSKPGVSRAEMIVFHAIARAAQAGNCCPTNNDICNMTGIRGVEIIKKLVKHGLIEVELFSNERRVTILETGAQTCVFNERPHWRDVGAGAAWNGRVAKPDPRRLAALSPRVRPMAVRPDLETRARVERDPCFKCGVRADVGCRHQRMGVSHAG